MFNRRISSRKRWHWTGMVVIALMASCATPPPPPPPPPLPPPQPTKAAETATPAPVMPRTVLAPTDQAPERVPIQPVVPPVAVGPPAKVVAAAAPAPARPAPAAPSAVAAPAVTFVIPAPPAPAAVPEPAVPPVVVAAAAPSANNSVLPNVANPREYRRDAAKHLYGQNAHRIYKGKMPAMLYAIGVLQVDVDGSGQVTRLNWMRAPKHAPEVVAEIERTVRRAAPFPPPARWGEVTYTDTWLWHKSGRFQLDTLTEGQL